MVYHSGAHGDGAGVMQSAMAAARRRGKNNVGYQDEKDCELQKPGEAE